MIYVSSLIIDLFEAIPTWSPENLLDLLKNQKLLFQTCREILIQKQIQRDNHTHKPEGNWELEYREAIARRFDELTLYGVEVSLEARRHQLSVAYISLSLSQLGSDDSGNLDFVESLSVEEVLSRHQRLVIQGMAGQGKTTLLHWLIVKCGRGEFTGKLQGWNQKIPFYIRLRDFAGKNMPTYENFVELMVEHIPFANKHREWSKALLDQGKALILVDGLDEIPQKQRAEIAKWLMSMCGQFGKNQFLITSRPAAFPKNWLKPLGFLEIVNGH